MENIRGRRRWRNHNFIFVLCMLVILSLSLVACGSEPEEVEARVSSSAKSKTSTKSGTTTKKRKTVTTVAMPEASGDVTYQSKDGSVQMDASNTQEGYVMVQYTGGADKVQVQVNNLDGTRYPFPLTLNKYEAIPFTRGDGTYQVDVLVHIKGSQYAVGLSQKIDVKLKNDKTPFLYPNQYCDYNPDMEAIRLARSLSQKSKNDLDFVTKVYDKVTGTVVYDTEFAKDIPVNYVADPDRTLETKKGICLDYAALMCSMLRSQNVPTKLEVGYSGDVYHAWVSVWIKNKGWVHNIIYFDGKEWKLMDPTLGSYAEDSSLKKYIGDGSNYTLRYEY